MKRFVTWTEVDNFVNMIVENYGVNSYTGVYGLPRGGLVIAVMLSHRLNIPLLAAPCDNCIIVDDICDSGQSLLHYAYNSSGESKYNADIFTMFYKQNSYNVVPEMWLHEKEDEWVVFPWENR